MIPVLPVINLPPPRELFLGIVFIPLAISLFLWISVSAVTIIIGCTYFCYRRQIFIVKNNSKIYGFMLSCYDKMEKLDVQVSLPFFL